MKKPSRETHNMLPENLHARVYGVISRLKSQLGHAWNQGKEFKMSNFHYSSTSMIKKKNPHWPLILHVKYKQQQWFILQNHQASF